LKPVAFEDCGQSNANSGLVVHEQDARQYTAFVGSLFRQDPSCDVIDSQVF
jgi:hypothetical protein